MEAVSLFIHGAMMELRVVELCRNLTLATETFIHLSGVLRLYPIRNVYLTSSEAKQVKSADDVIGEAAQVCTRLD
jgi:hypothetical protein